MTLSDLQNAARLADSLTVLQTRQRHLLVSKSQPPTLAVWTDIGSIVSSDDLRTTVIPAALDSALTRLGVLITGLQAQLEQLGVDTKA